MIHLRKLPAPELLRRLVEYRPETGELVWLPRIPEMFKAGRFSALHACRVWNTKNAGRPAFANKRKDGYFSGTLLGELHLAHRVAWAIHFQVSDFGLIGHLDDNGLNNRIQNLFSAERETFSQNCLRRKDSSSGVTGVHWHVNKRWGTPRWVARIQVGNKRIRLGSYDRLEDAAAARRLAEIQYGFGAKHGKGST